jgi:hypothetical protein
MPEEKITQMMSSLGMEDMNIPELKINQATGGDFAKESLKAQLGQMYVSTTGDVYDQVDVQVFMVNKNRTFWGRTDITDDPPICSSLDGLTSVDGQVCKTCQHFRERANPDKDERRKECQTGYVVLALDTNQMPLVIRLNGISADTARNLNTQLYYNKGVRANRGGFFFRITSMKKKTAAGEAWMFNFTLLKDKFPDESMRLEYHRVASDMGMLATMEAPQLATEQKPQIEGTKEPQQPDLIADSKAMLKKMEEANPPPPGPEPGEVIEDLKF